MPITESQRKKLAKAKHIARIKADNLALAYNMLEEGGFSLNNPPPHDHDLYKAWQRVFAHKDVLYEAMIAKMEEAVGY